ncbi:MAG TPA: GNAT family N-acetyltransferase [Galbitalea sp.]|jgi:predicted acetyltransferase|nr:GNAT family N-acetyltransferase [Galbitalea sp.]
MNDKATRDAEARDKKVRTAAIDAISKKKLAAQSLRFERIATSDDEFVPWFQGMSRGFLGTIVEDESLESRREAFAHRRIVGIWDDSLADAATPVGTSSAWIAPLTVPGAREIPSWAISTVTVAPTHHRRGLARAMVEAELRTAASFGVPVAILTASEATIYERYGFAPAAMRADWTIDTRRAQWIGPEPTGRVQLVSTEQARDGGGHDIVERARLQVPGQLGFDGHHWNRMFGLKGVSNPAEHRVVRYDDAEGVQQGIAIYVAKDEGHHSSTISVKYLAAVTDDAYAGLWRYLIEMDLIGSVVAELRSTDEPIRWQISDARAAHEDRVGDHLWLRILDVPATLQARHYSAPGTFVLELSDPLGFAEGSWLLSIDDAGAAKVEKLGDVGGFADNHRLRLSQNSLAAAYLGATSFGTLARAGRIQEKTKGAALAADAAFRSPVTPWLSIWF